MRIAILGWGSLYWDPRELAFTGEWNPDGPWLPIEFGRISSGNRISLIIKAGYPEVKALYCHSAFTTLEEARENLMGREGTTTINNIGFLSFNDHSHHVRTKNTFMLDIISHWNLTKEFDAVIWSDFAPNFQDKIKRPLTAENIANFILEQSPEEKRNAIEYVIKTPPQIQTRYRPQIEQLLHGQM